MGRCVLNWQLFILYTLLASLCTASLTLQKSHVLPTQCIYVFCVDLRTNCDYFPVQCLLAGYYNRDGVCLLRGTDWIFKCNLRYTGLRWFMEEQDFLP